MFSNTLEQEAADGDHVGGEQGEESQGDDDVEGGGRSEIYEADDTGAYRGDIDGIFGDVTLVIHLYDSFSLRFPAPGF